MPRRVRKRGRSTFRRRRRTVKRRFTRRPRTVRRTRHLVIGGFPKSHIVKLRYTDNKSYNAGVVTPAFNTYSCNDMFDPDFSGVGHQPKGFDQWMLAYTHFTVLSSRITCRVTQQDAGDQLPCVVVIIKASESNTHTSVTSIEILKETPMLQGSRMLYFGGAQGYNKVLTSGWSSRRWFGKRFIVGSRDYQGSTGAGPVEQAFYTVKQYPVGGTDPPLVSILTSIDYVAVLTEPKFIGPS